MLLYFVMGGPHGGPAIIEAEDDAAAEKVAALVYGPQRPGETSIKAIKPGPKSQAAMRLALSEMPGVVGRELSFEEARDIDRQLAERLRMAVQAEKAGLN